MSTSSTERRAEAEHVRGQSEEFEIATSRIEREISLLREYRIRLLADVVTGKLDVREAAARLPELAPEPTEDVENPEPDESVEDLAEADA